MQSIRHEWLILALLCFADDVAVSGHPHTQAWFLTHARAWAALRHLRFSPKSRLMTLTTPGGCEEQPLHGLDFPLLRVTKEEGFFKYLGHPMRRNPRRSNGYVSVNPTI